MARASSKSKKKTSGKVSLNFKGVETRVMLPENDYLLSVVSLEEADEQVVVGLKIEKGKFAGKTVKEYFSTKPQALWRFGNFIAACGLQVPDDEVELDASDFADVKVMGVCTHDEYEGKTRMRWDFYGADDADEEDGDEDEQDEDDKKSSKKSGKDKKAKEIEKVGADEVNEADEDELVEIIERTGIDVDLDDHKKIAKKRAAVLEALEEADLLESDEEEEADEDEDDKKGKKAEPKGKKGKKADKVDGSEVEDMDEDALGELIEEHDLEVDLDDHKTLRKKVRAVLDALEAADLLAE